MQKLRGCGLSSISVFPIRLRSAPLAAAYQLVQRDLGAKRLVSSALPRAKWRGEEC